MLNKCAAMFVIFLGLLVLAGCSDYANVPPPDLGMQLTPTGFENKIYTPGQIDLGTLDQSGRGNRLVLIQRSGIQIKEQFLGTEGNKDKEDHRCLTADKAPMTLDIRILLALPDYEAPDGKKDMARVFLLGNPLVVADASPKGRVLRISGESIYVEQAQQQVRGKIRQICMKYRNFDEALAAFGDESEKGLSRSIETAVATALKDQNIPLRVVSAFVSNMKPDPSVIAAISAKLAADKRVEAIKTLTDFMSADASGARWRVYNMQVLQEIVSQANANGHNTMVFTDMGTGGSKIIPLPTGK